MNVKAVKTVSIKKAVRKTNITAKFRTIEREHSFTVKFLLKSGKIEKSIHIRGSAPDLLYPFITKIYHFKAKKEDDSKSIRKIVLL
jgi:hypothetical protein